MSTTLVVSHSGPSPKWKKFYVDCTNGRDRLSAGDRDDPGTIALIDMGQVMTTGAGGVKQVKHPELAGRIVNSTDPADSADPSRAGHAVEVAGILAACCEAGLRHYNVWGATGLEVRALYDALVDVAALPDVRVLNLSIGSREYDPVVERLIWDCIGAKKIVVAAAGDYGNDEAVYPGAIEGVIAVGAHNRHGRPTITTNYDRAFIAAPGESIVVPQDDDSYRKQDGTSYATAMVSAAAWLALRYQPGLNQEGMRALLLNTARRPIKGGDERQVGCGLLDLCQLADAVGAP